MTQAADSKIADQVALLATGERIGGPPTWLAANIPALIEMLRASHDVRRRNPRDLRDKLKTVERAARNLKEALNEPDIVSYLAAADRSLPVSGLDYVLASAPEIIRRARAALNLVPSGQGKRRNSAGSPALDDRIRCAAIVAECWRAARESTTVPNSDAAYQAADLLWRASGGRPLGSKDDAIERWRRPFEALGSAEKDHAHELQLIRSLVRTRPINLSVVRTGD